MVTTTKVVAHCAGACFASLSLYVTLYSIPLDITLACYLLLYILLWLVTYSFTFLYMLVFLDVCVPQALGPHTEMAVASHSASGISFLIILRVRIGVMR